MNILVTGGTGLIGSSLIPKLLTQGASVVVLTRNVPEAENVLGSGVEYLSSLDSVQNLDDFDAVINLAGEPIVNKRWSEQQKRKIEHSRWDITKQLVQLCKASASPPHTVLSGSAIGYYGRQDHQVIDESFDQPHDEFSHTLCKKWESIALGAQSDKTRVCILRTGIVLANNGGALSKMALPFKLGLGGPIGDGEHYMSWIHLDDMVAGILFLLDNKSCHGVYNFTAPKPVTNKVFSKSLANAVDRPCILFTPKFALKLAMGEMADLLIYGQNVVPKRLQQDGFKFSYIDIDSAFANLRL